MEYSGLLLSALGAGLAWGGYLKKAKYRKLQKSGIKIQGIVESLHHELGTGGPGLYYPMISYSVGDKLITKRYFLGSNPSMYRTGESVPIIYNPDDVNEYVVDNKKNSIVMDYMIWIGGILILAGLAYWLFGEYQHPINL